MRMDLGLKGKVALITGGSKGIGLETAAILCAEGAEVAICARGEADLLAAAEHIERRTGRKPLHVQADVTVESDCKRVVEQTVERFGRLDIVVNNAGTASASPFEQTSVDMWRYDLESKLFGAVYFLREAIPHLRKAGGGAIVNLSTSSAKTPGPRSFPTSVSRAAGQALTNALSKELAPDNIRVNAVCIGSIRSDQVEKVWQAQAPQQTWEEYARDPRHNIPMGRIGETVEAANVIVFLVSQAASYVTGTSVNVDGGVGHAL